MKTSLFIRRALVSTAVVLASMVVLIAATIAMLSAALDAGHLRGPFISFLTAHAGRKIQIDGAVETHFLSRHPRLTLERVTIGNPPWTPPGITAEIEKIDLRFEIPGGIQRLEIEGASLHLLRDARGHANWQRTDPDKGPQADVPLIRSLSMPGAHVELDDALRHLQFKGSVSAQDVKGVEAPPALRIEGLGQLNGKEDRFEITGDPLATASRKNPYGFVFAERSSGSHLTGSGSLLRAFDFDAIDAKFEASGEDLEDMYFLTGVTLINTGSYRLSGKVARRGTHTEFSNLAVASGQSDVLVNVSIESASGRPQFTAEFNSKTIRTADLGARAAGREHDPDAGKLLLSNAMLTPSALRHGDWAVQFRAGRVEVGHVLLQQAAAQMTIVRGIAVIDQFRADVLGGKVTAHVRLDAKTDNPAADVDLKLTGLQLGEFAHKDPGPPPAEGAIQARVSVSGRGRSIHQVAASANGKVTAVVTHGTVRSSLAELAGIDLRALGLIAAKNKRDTGIRCVVAGFQAHDGTLDAQSLVIDTDPVLITGEGRLRLDSESLDFALHGHPKSLRLIRLHAPIIVRGTLVHPSIGIQARNAVAQSAGAIALGVVLTPLATILAFVDPGLAKDADCASLQQQVTASVR